VLDAHWRYVPFQILAYYPSLLNYWHICPYDGTILKVLTLPFIYLCFEKALFMENILTWIYFTDIIFFSCFSLFKATSNQRYCCVDWLLKIYLDHEAKSVNLYYCCSCLPYKQQRFCGTFIKMPTDQHFTNFFGPLGSALDLESHLREDVNYLTWWCSFYVQYELSQIRLKEKNCCFHFCWIFNFYEYLWEQMNDINAGIWLSDDQRECVDV